ncbi:MAG: deoxyribodipyrimidine photo-lyase [Gammaproteobacteria bacterium]|nr:deoxyribodipyrimidine photo-lyase [Gammaproteobacteria bacterium]
MNTSRSIIWFRQDLRVEDNPALEAAILAGAILPIYILDDNSAGSWKMGAASRWWLHHSLTKLNERLNGKLYVFRGEACKILKRLTRENKIQKVFWNRCYEPWRTARDEIIKKDLEGIGLEVKSFNGSLLWEPWDILKADDTPYKVFTPFYKRALTSSLSQAIPQNYLAKLETIAYLQSENKINSLELLPKNNWHDSLSNNWCPGEIGGQRALQEFLRNRIPNYKSGRDYPALNAVSRISPHLHFGELSAKQIWKELKTNALHPKIDSQIEHFQRELVWREFSYSLLFHFPSITEKNMNEKFNLFPWEKNEDLLTKWQRGQTGFPLIDAGMRELWQTGYMHNRVRMIVASFLVKNLLIHWKEGARWFWDCLVDADLASNTCSWQWVAGCGVDAAPYFRIFNPVTQSLKFDANADYIKTYVPELENCPTKFIHNPSSAPDASLKDVGIKLGTDYPRTIVDLKLTRTKALEAYKNMRQEM